jgi:hypothetical protein
MSFLERLLCKLLPYRDIVKVVDGKETLYLRRFFLKRSQAKSMTGDEGGVFLHVIHRNDDDKDPHDHPWDFTSVVLKGGYVDECWHWIEDAGAGRRLPGTLFRVKGERRPPEYERVRPLRVVQRKAEHLHRVQGIKPGRPAWTLVFTGPRRRSWGFVTENGWRHWRDYLGLPKEQVTCFCPNKYCEHRARAGKLTDT